VAGRAHLLGVREHALGDVRLEDPGDRQRVAGRLQHDPVRRREAPPEQRKLLGSICPAERARPPSAIATRQRSRCTSNPIDLPITPEDNRCLRRQQRSTPARGRRQARKYAAATAAPAS
jgi:hypothetical protein